MSIIPGNSVAPKRVLFLIGFFSTLFMTSVMLAEVYIWQDENHITNISNIKPDWWTDEMSQQEQGTVVFQGESTPLPGKFVGDKENRKFHRISCEQIYNPQGKMAIPPEKIVWFQSTDEALSQTFIACDHCKPTSSTSDKNQ